MPEKGSESEVDDHAKAVALAQDLKGVALEQGNRFDQRRLGLLGVPEDVPILGQLELASEKRDVLGFLNS